MDRNVIGTYCQDSINHLLAETIERVEKNLSHKIG